MKTEKTRPVKQNYNKSGKLAKRRAARREQAIARQSARLEDLKALDAKYECPAISELALKASLTYNSL